MFYEQDRKKMIEEQIIARNIRDERVIKAMSEIKRELFVSDNLKRMAYYDSPLPIDKSQTISQPYIVARMTELLNVEDDNIVLEIGTGSGYQAAVLSKLCKRVYTMERILELRKKAGENLKKHNIKNVIIICGDGTIGLSQYAPFDRIIVTAASPSIPNILIDQLKDKGIMVIPIGNMDYQYLIRIKKNNGKIYKEQFDACRFVPLLGKYGFKDGV